LPPTPVKDECNIFYCTSIQHSIAYQMSRSRDENSEIIHPSSSPRPNPPSPLNTKSRVPQASNHRPPPHENPMPSDQEKAHPPSPVGGSRTKALTAAPQIDVNYSSHGYVCMTLVMAIHTHGPIVILGYSQIPHGAITTRSFPVILLRYPGVTQAGNIKFDHEVTLESMMLLIDTYEMLWLYLCDTWLIHG
jgi:uncharacterized Zn-finger protein